MKLPMIDSSYIDLDRRCNLLGILGMASHMALSEVAVDKQCWALSTQCLEGMLHQEYSQLGHSAAGFAAIVGYTVLTGFATADVGSWTVGTIDSGTGLLTASSYWDWRYAVAE